MTDCVRLAPETTAEQRAEWRRALAAGDDINPWDGGRTFNAPRVALLALLNDYDALAAEMDRLVAELRTARG